MVGPKLGHLFEFVTVIHGSHHMLGNTIQYRSIWMALLVDLPHIHLKDLKPRNKRSRMEISVASCSFVGMGIDPNSHFVDGLE